MAKREKVFNIVTDAATWAVVVTAGGKTARVDCSTLTADLIRQAAMHGIKQKIGDAGAVEADEVTGKVDPAEKIRRVFEMADRIARGVWNERASGGTSDDVILARAMVAAYPSKTAAQVDDYLGKLTPAQRRALVADTTGKLAPFVAAERAKAVAGVDTEALLEGFAAA